MTGRFTLEPATQRFLAGMAVGICIGALFLFGFSFFSGSRSLSFGPYLIMYVPLFFFDPTMRRILRQQGRDQAIVHPLTSGLSRGYLYVLPLWVILLMLQAVIPALR